MFSAGSWLSWYCASRFADPEPTSAFAGSLARGRLHAEICADGSEARRVEALVRPRLAELERRWGHRIENPRATGYAIAFEVKSGAEMNAYLEQRFWRGAIVYGAGSRTVRYRLSDAFLDRDIEFLFETMRRSLSWLDAHPHAAAPSWEDPTPAPRAARQPLEMRVRQLDVKEGLELLPAILDMECAIYEPARRTPGSRLRRDGTVVYPDAG